MYWSIYERSSGKGCPGFLEEGEHSIAQLFVIEHVADQVAHVIRLAELAEVDLLEQAHELVRLPCLLKGRLDLGEIAADKRGIALEDDLVVVQGERGLAFLHELLGDLVAQLGIVRPQRDDLGELVPRLVALARSLVIVGQRLVNLDRVGCFLELFAGAVDQLGQAARTSQDAHGGGAAGVGVFRIIDVGVGLAHRRRRAQDLRGHLHGDIELALTLVLEHQAHQRGGLVAGTAAGTAEHGVGELVQAELVHLAGQAHLGVGIQPQAKEALGRLACAVEVAGQDREPQRDLLAPLHGGVVERLNRIRHGQGIGPLALLFQELRQVEPQVRFGLGGFEPPW